MQKKPDDTKASKRILLVAPSPAGRGGISSMVNALYHSQLAEEYSLFWLHVVFHILHLGYKFLFLHFNIMQALSQEYYVNYFLFLLKT